MRVNASNGGIRAYTSNTGSASHEIAQLRQQRILLQKQLQAVKSKAKSSPTERDAAAKQRQIIKKKIAAIDKQIRALTQRKQREQGVSKTSPAASAETQSSRNRTLSAARSREQDEVGRLLDVYV